MKAGWEKLITAARTAESQRAGVPSWLQTCLEHNAAAEYGRIYGFENIRDVDDYRTRVPLSTYEDLKPFIEKILAGTADVLFAGSPMAFEKTGGSGGGEKIIPYSRESLRDFRNALLPWIASLARIYGLGSGRVYLAISPALRAAQTTPSGVPIGLPDGAYLGQDVLEAFADLSVVPPEIQNADSFEKWQLSTLYHLLKADDLEFISVWSPTFMLNLIDGVLERKHELMAMFRREETYDANTLKRLDAWDGTDTKNLWPNLKVISCWMDGPSAHYAERLRQRMPRAEMQSKGLLMTEGVVTVPDENGQTLLALGSGFFEFVDDCGRSRLYHELAEDEVYEVVMTTAGGLYRYRTGDSVRCEGYVGKLPVLRFVGRNGVFADLVGEKLSDAFVSECMSQANFSGMLIPLSAPGPGYLLLTEREPEPGEFERFEEGLRRNPQYAYARKMRQLFPTRFKCVSALSKRYAEYAVSCGRRLGDVKMPALCTDPNWRDEVAKL
jgi:hypothetical protein